jgi:hypothetical protein
MKLLVDGQGNVYVGGTSDISVGVASNRDIVVLKYAPDGHGPDGVVDPLWVCHYDIGEEGRFSDMAVTAGLSVLFPPEPRTDKEPRVYLGAACRVQESSGAG